MPPLLLIDPLAGLRQRCGEDWLMGEDSHSFWTEVERRQNALRPTLETGRTLVLLSESHPVFFLASFMAACSLHCSIILGNPQWGQREWEQVSRMLSPTLVWGEAPLVPGGGSPTDLPPGAILMPTGGSSGQLRFAIHTWQTLVAAVAGFQQYFGGDRLNSCCVLPLYHVSGLMQVMRSFTTGGQLAIHPYKLLEAGHLPELTPPGFFLSLVPTQLHRLLPHPHLLEWLRGFRAILLGGAPAWPDLLHQARSHHLPLAPTYGMTETASQVATLKPEAFLAGQGNAGHPLPHVRLSICNPNGTPVPSGQAGRLRIEAPSLFLGYVPAPSGERQGPSLLTDDMGLLDEQGYLHVIGRDSQKIITGGENVFPEELEAAIRSVCPIDDVCVVGLPDAEWGEIVTAVYVPRDASVTVEQMRRSLQGHLSRYKLPKRWVPVEYLPRNAQGKINRETVRQGVLANPVFPKFP